MTGLPTPPDDAAFRQALYGRYSEWKGWTPFAYTPEQAETYRGELGTADLAGRALLEIGFGPGSLLAWARDHGARVAGAEVGRDSLDAAAAHGIELLPADLAGAVEANRGRFDYIVAFDVFEHLTLAQIVANLDHCAALLKPDGLLLLRFPNAQSPFGAYHQYADVTHVTPLSGDVLGQLVLDGPLEMVSVKAAYRPRGDTVGRRIVRWVRYRLQDLVQLSVRFVFVYTAPIASVVTVTLKRRP